MEAPQPQQQKQQQTAKEAPQAQPQQQQEDKEEQKDTQAMAKVPANQDPPAASPKQQEGILEVPLPLDQKEGTAQPKQLGKQVKAHSQKQQHHQRQQAMYQGGQQQQQREVKESHQHQHKHKQKVSREAVLEQQAHSHQAVLKPAGTAEANSIGSMNSTVELLGAGMLLAPVGEVPSQSGPEG